MSLTSRLASLENLIARDPDDVSLRREHASCLTSLAHEHGVRHEFEAALTRCRAAQRAHVRWCDPCRSERRTRRTGDVCSGLAALRELQADLVTAWALEAGGTPHVEALLREQLLEAREKGRLSPAESARLALTALRLGEESLRLGDAGEALPLLEEAVDGLRVEMLRETPTEEVELGLVLGLTSFSEALWSAEGVVDGAREGAVAAAHGAIALAEEAAGGHPLRAARTGLPYAVLQLGNVLLAGGAPGDALPLLERSLALLRSHLEARPDDERAQRAAARTLAAQAVALLRLARWEEGLDVLTAAQQLLVRRIDEIRRDFTWDDLEDLADRIFEVCELPGTPGSVRARLLGQVEGAARAALHSSMVCVQAPGVLRRVERERNRAPA